MASVWGLTWHHSDAISGLAVVTLLAVWLFVSNALLLMGYKIALDG